jgi:hypothetical protein
MLPVRSLGVVAKKFLVRIDAAVLDHADSRMILAYSIVSPVRINPMADGIRFLRSRCGSNVNGIPLRPSSNSLRVAVPFVDRNSSAMNAAPNLQFSRSALSTCRTRGMSSTREISTVSIPGKNGKPRSAITNVLVCRTRLSSALMFGFRMPRNNISYPPFLRPHYGENAA